MAACTWRKGEKCAATQGEDNAEIGCETKEAVRCAMKILTALCGSLFLLTATSAQSYRPKAGFVPDSATAIKIAEAVLTPVYSEDKIVAERPFSAELKGDVWTVAGTLHCTDERGKPVPSDYCHGGVATVRLSRIDGRILFMIHGK